MRAATEICKMDGRAVRVAATGTGQREQRACLRRARCSVLRQPVPARFSIYVLDTDHIKRSDDGGKTWALDLALEAELTWGNRIAVSDPNAPGNDNTSGLGDHFDLILTDMKFDPNNPLVRFAIGQGGVFYTTDGAAWSRLLHTGAFAGRPSSCYYDWITNPSNPALYVSLAGRGIVKIDGFMVPQQTVTVVPTTLTFPTQQVGTTSLQQTVTVTTGSEHLQPSLWLAVPRDRRSTSPPYRLPARR